MKRHFSNDELATAQGDPLLLGQLISASCGYVLARMKKQNMSPSLDVLMACLSSDSVMFILDNYPLERAEQRMIAPFFKSSMASARLGGALDEESVNALLQEGEMLAAGTILTETQLRSFPTEINALYERDEALMDEIVCASTARLGFEAALSLDASFLWVNLRALESMPGFFASPERRESYMNLALLRRSQGGAPPRWREFESWPFSPADRPFLLGLIAGAPAMELPSYKELSANPWAKALVSLPDYFNAAGALDLSQFAAAELLDCVDQIRESWLSRMFSEERPRLESCIRNRCGNEVFKLIVDAGFVAAALSRGARCDPRGIASSSSPTEKGIHLLASLAEALLGMGAPACSQSRALSRAIPQLAEALQELSLVEDSPLPSLASQCCQRLAPAIFSIHNIDLLDGYSQRWASPLAEPAARAVFLESSSPNMLCWALHAWARGGERSSGARPPLTKVFFEELAVDIAARLGCLSAKTLCLSFGLPLPLGQKFSDKPSDPTSDFLQSSYDQFYKLDLGIQQMLVRRDPLFFERFCSSGAEPCEWIFSTVFSQRDVLGGLLAQLVERFPDAARSCHDFARAAEAKGLFLDVLRSSPEGLGATWASLAPRLEASAMLRESIQSDYSQLESKLPDLDWSDFAADDIPIGPLRELSARCDEHSDILEEQRRSSVALAKALSEDFLSERANEALALRRYGFVYELSELASRSRSSSKLSSIFREHLQSLSCVDFLAAYEPGSPFWDLVTRQASLAGHESLGLDFGSARDNAAVAQSLVGAGIDFRPEAFLSFSVRARKGFVEDFIVEHFPEKALADSSLSFRRGQADSPNSNSIATRPYEVDEIIRIWDAACSRGDLFSSRSMDAPNCLQGFLADAIGSDENIFSMLVEKSKTRPILHCLLASSRIAGGFASAIPELSALDNGRACRDEKHMLHVAHRFDWRILCQGVADVFEVLREFPNSNAKTAHSIVDATCWASNYPVSGASGSDCASILTHGQSVDLLRVFCHHAPAHLYSLRYAGSICVEREGARIIVDECADQALDQLILHSDLGRSEHCSIFAPPSIVNPRALAILFHVCSKMVSESRRDDLELMDWMLKSRAFKRSELQGRHQGFEPASRIGISAIQCIDAIAATPELRSAVEAGIERLEIAAVVGDNATRRKKAFRM